MSHLLTCYIAGPMRGYPRFNFDAFMAAGADLKAKGWCVHNPAEKDIANGFNPDKHDESFFKDFTALIRTDIEDVLKSDAIVLLPGWQKSSGACAELAVAKWAKKSVLTYPDMKDLEDECVLAEAGRLTRGDRQSQYGPPDVDFKRTAALWSALKGVSFEAREVAMFMVCLKLSREQHQRKRDNWVDIAGYARCGSLCK
jgi:hypothetical protein